MSSLNPLALNVNYFYYILNNKQAFRWSALALGLYYGYSKHASLVQFVETRNISLSKQHHEELIKEAKIAYEAQYNREQAVLAKEQGGMWMRLFILMLV